jgi:predicted RNase H-like HicB family nuclease
MLHVISGGDWTAPRDTYRVIVHVTRGPDGTFLARAAQLPGAGGRGDTLPEALANAGGAVRGVLLSYRGAGEPVPWADEPPLPFGAERACVLVPLAPPTDPAGGVPGGA